MVTTLRPAVADGIITILQGFESRPTRVASGRLLVGPLILAPLFEYLVWTRVLCVVLAMLLVDGWHVVSNIWTLQRRRLPTLLCTFTFTRVLKWCHIIPVIIMFFNLWLYCVWPFRIHCYFHYFTPKMVSSIDFYSRPYNRWAVLVGSTDSHFYFIFLTHISPMYHKLHFNLRYFTAVIWYMCVIARRSYQRHDSLAIEFREALCVCVIA